MNYRTGDVHMCGQIISVCNSERIIKSGQYLRQLCSNEKGPVFLTHSVENSDGTDKQKYRCTEKRISTPSNVYPDLKFTTSVQSLQAPAKRHAG